MKKEPTNPYDEIPVIDLLGRIKAKTLDPICLPKETRQACVEVLFFDGYHQTQMASLLKTCDRTIRRDIVDIRKRNALQPSPELTKVLVGDTVAMARAFCARLKQIARSKNATPRQMTDAEFLAWTVMKEMFEKLDSIDFFRTEKAHSQPFKAIDESSFTEEDRAIKKIYEAMHPQEREKLAERLQRDINRIAEGKSGDKPEQTDKPPSTEGQA